MLALGLASSLALAAAAFLPFSDPESAGRAQLAQLASRAVEGVISEWEVMRRTDDEFVRQNPYSWSDAEAAKPVEPVPSIVENPDDPHALVFDALFAESEQAEIQRKDLRDALALLDEALEKTSDPVRRGRAHLRAIQLAINAGLDARAREHWEGASRELTGAEVLDGTSILLLCTLAAAPHFAENDRCPTCERIEEAWLQAKLPVSGESKRLVPGIGEHGARYQEERHDNARELRIRFVEKCFKCLPTEARSDALSNIGRIDLLRRTLGGLPRRPEDALWHFAVVTPDFFAFHAVDDGSAQGQFFFRPELGARIARQAQQAGLLDDGFNLDFSDEGSGVGQMVRPRTELPGIALGFTLRHPDPESIVRRVSRRAAWLRFGLLAMATLAAAASVATFRAQRRERRLAEARTVFIANVSHELRTPLASILLMAENLESGRAGANEPRYHALIRREALRLRRLVDDVLDFSRMERGKPFELRVEEVDPSEWYESLRADLAAFAEQSGASVQCVRGELPGRAAFDREALRRAVFNLVDNALRHSGTKGADVRIEADASRGAGTLTITVADRGRGIPLAQRREIFEPFARLSQVDAPPGAGLGLAIVREIVESHGGTIRVRDPDQGPGTVFEIRIPLEAPTTKESSS